MKLNAGQLDWFVGSPTGVCTRVDYDTPTGAHPLTPEQIRQRYTSEVRNSALVVWHLPDSGIGGVRVASWRFWDRHRERDLAQTGSSGELNPELDDVSHTHDPGDVGGSDHG